MKTLLALFALSLLSLFSVQAQPSGTIPPAVAYLPLIINPAPTEMSTATPTATATPLPSPTPTATPLATATPLLYICDHDAYNCDNFHTRPEAQAVFDYCMELGYGDIHHLDQNNDNIACNALPPLWEIYR